MLTAQSESIPVISQVSQMKDEAYSDATERQAIWDECWKLYNGTIWDTTPDDWTAKERVTINLLKATIAAMSPIIGDAVPTWYVKAYDPLRDDAADVLTRFIQGVWFEQRLDRVYQLVRKDALVIGTGAMKVFLNTTKQRGAMPTALPQENGFVDVAYLSPYQLYPDPNSENLEDCRYVNIRTVLDESMVQKLYPEADVTSMEPEHENERRGQLYGDAKNSGGERRYEVWETYHEYGARLTIWSGSEVLYDGDSPVPSGRFPVVLFIDDERGTDMWGGGVIWNGGDEIQKAIANLIWRINCHARLCVSPRFVKKGIGTLTGFKTDPGSVATLNSNTADLTPLMTPDLPPYVFSLLQMYLQLWDNMTGIHDVTQGKRPVGVQSGAAILKLQEAGQTRIRELIRVWSLQLGDVGQLVLEMMQAYYSGVKSVFQMKSSGPERVSIHADEVLWEPVLGEDGTLGRNPIPYRVVVQPQSDLPLSASAQAELVMQISAVLPNLPLPLQKMVLSLLRLPGREEYFEGLKEQAMGMLEQARGQELEAGLHTREDLSHATSPAPIGQDTSAMDTTAMMAAMTAGAQGGSPMGGETEEVPQ